MHDYVTTRQAAEALEVSVATICRWIKEQQVAAERVGWQWMIHRDELKRVIEMRK